MIDYCASRPCMNGGQCLSGINGNQYRCQCPAGFTGSQCQQDINECSSSTPACLNGGTCINTFGGYRCVFTCYETMFGESSPKIISEQN
jgi:EGF-like domain/Calcium-binding EGF domain